MDLLPWPSSELTQERSKIQYFFGFDSNMTKLKGILLDIAADKILDTISCQTRVDHEVSHMKDSSSFSSHN